MSSDVYCRALGGIGQELCIGDVPDTSVRETAPITNVLSISGFMTGEDLRTSRTSGAQRLRQQRHAHIDVFQRGGLRRTGILRVRAKQAIRSRQTKPLLEHQGVLPEKRGRAAYGLVGRSLPAGACVG
ncbi:MAG: hypothetical protein CMJ58_24735 [Planctomycetaceae bacterium]|nr:hypothetical protein [Planctomycetaceae bacterium]